VSDNMIPMGGDQDDDLRKVLQENVAALNRHAEEVENMLTQSLAVLTRIQGGTSGFDSDALLMRGRESRTTLQKNSKRIIVELDEMRQLVHTSAVITASLEIDHVLSEVLDTVIALSGAERGYLMMTKGEDDLLVRAARNNRGENILDTEITFSRGVIKSALENNQPVLATNAQEDERFQEMMSVMRNDLRSIMVIPMILQQVTIGVLYLDNRLSSAVFHKKSVPVLTAFANQAAIAIENARLFERVQESLERTKREVKRLRIQLDEQKLKTQVSDIVGSDYFQHIADMAKDLRDRGDR
jgi:transcriptional regulator with GAF, ATPase, and Fis domain